uniref:Uncharacterized protein n=1 Tax=Oryza rufipogon TaxID=4529 RepID=A0A0E0QAP9_ORYRU
MTLSISVGMVEAELLVDTTLAGILVRQNVQAEHVNSFFFLSISYYAKDENGLGRGGFTGVIVFYSSPLRRTASPVV